MRKHVKALLIILLTLAMTLNLIACGKTETANNTQEPSINTDDNGSDTDDSNTDDSDQDDNNDSDSDPNQDMSIDDMNAIINNYTNKYWLGDDGYSYIDFSGENGSYVLWTSFYNEDGNNIYYDKGQLTNFEYGPVTVNSDGYLVLEVKVNDDESIIYVLKEDLIEGTYQGITRTFKLPE